MPTLTILRLPQRCWPVALTVVLALTFSDFAAAANSAIPYQKLSSMCPAPNTTLTQVQKDAFVRNLNVKMRGKEVVGTGTVYDVIEPIRGQYQVVLEMAPLEFEYIPVSSQLAFRLKKGELVSFSARIAKIQSWPRVTLSNFKILQIKPAPARQQKDFLKPARPDLQAALKARLDQGRAQEEERENRVRSNATRNDEPTPSGTHSTRSLVGRVAPSYPMSSQRAGHEGTVIVRIWVAPSGLVSRAEVTKSSGYEALDKAAVAAAKQWRFTPSQGPSTEFEWGEIPFNFRI